MALLEKGIELSRLPTPRIAVARTLHGLPALEEALSPAHIQAAMGPFLHPEIQWKLHHELRVGVSSGEVQDELGSSHATSLANRRAGLVHDCGQASDIQDGAIRFAPKKIALLNKPGLFTVEDWKAIHSHPEEAAGYLEQYDESEAAILVFYHHALQGSNSYPREINKQAFETPRQLQDIAIFAAIDTTDALFTPRPYPKWTIVNDEHVLELGTSKEAWTTDSVKEELDRKFGDILPGEIIELVTKVGEKHAGKTSDDFAMVA